ncbi:MAG: nucleotide exchange factor GrpE [Blastocatellales bacterium]
MDSLLEVTDQPRAVAAGAMAETPLVTMAWRALRAEHQRRAEERQREHRDAGRVAEAMASVAEEAHRLRRMAQASSVSQAEQILATANRIESALAGVELKIIAPEGEPFDGELMELLENIAQQPDPEAREPRVAEVITPTIIYRGAMLRMGKAIIAVPATTGDGRSIEERA